MKCFTNHNTKNPHLIYLFNGARKIALSTFHLSFTNTSTTFTLRILNQRRLQIFFIITPLHKSTTRCTLKTETHSQQNMVVMTKNTNFKVLVTYPFDRTYKVQPPFVSFTIRDSNITKTVTATTVYLLVGRQSR
jgi:hypothetical protein